MIRSESIPYWPEKVAFTDGRIHDYSLGGSHSVSEVATELLGEVDGEISIEQIATIVSERHQWPIEKVLPDLMQLVTSINQQYLLNIRQPFRFSIWTKDVFIAILFFFRTLQGVRWEVKHRLYLPKNGGAFRIFLWLFQHVVKIYGKAALFFSGLVTFFVLLLPYGAWFDGLLTGFFFLIGMTLHEFGHYYTFQSLTDKQFGIFLATRRGAIQVVRPRVDLRQKYIQRFGDQLCLFFCL